MDAAQPLIVAAGLWWASTGLILWLVRRDAASFGVSLALGAVVACAAMIALRLSADDTSSGGAYVAFGAALAVWGWHEMGFLMGKLTGPRRTPCPEDAKGWRRFTVSAETVIHHEIALALTALAFVALTWGQPNQVGTLTFLLLFGMRLSTKLNIFLGVPNPPSSLLPRGLAYLSSYFRKARFNALFPVSLAASIVVTILLAEAAWLSSGGVRTGYVLMLSLAALGLLEHGFLMLPASRRPSPESALWSWALGRNTKSTQVVLAKADQ
jgi:putative photosynthetic complex assembly protein 2